jgi:hypothetical protein
MTYHFLYIEVVIKNIKKIHKKNKIKFYKKKNRKKNFFFYTPKIISQK